MTWKTVKEAAEMLGCSEKTIRRKADAGLMKTKMEFTGKGKGGNTQFVFIEPTNGQMDILKNQDEQMDISQQKTEQVDTIDNKIAHPGVQKCVQTTNEQMDNSYKSFENSELRQMDTSGHLKNLMDTNGQCSEQMDNQENKNTQMDILKNQDEQMDISENWIPIDDAVKLTGLSRRTIYNKINNKELCATSVSDKLSKTKTIIKIDGFSKEVQLKWKELTTVKDNSLIIIEKDKKEFELKSSDIKEKAWSRYIIVKALREVKEQAKANKYPLISAYNQFVDQLNHFEVFEPEMRKLGCSVSLKSILRWDKSLRDNDDPAFPLCLCDNKKGSVGRKRLADRLMINHIKKMAWDFRDLKATEIYRLLEMEKMSTNQEMPITVRTLSDIVRKAREDELAMAVNRGKKNYKDTIRPHVHRINNAMPGEIYESDGHKLNNLVKSPFYNHYQPSFRFLVRPIMVTWYDVATGLIVGNCLCLAENANAVRTALSQACTNFAIPENLRMDNGSAYKNVDHCPHVFAGRKGNNPSKYKALEMISNGNNGLYNNIGLNYSFTIPGNSESKMIEPFWGFCVSMFEKAFPVWIGGKIQDRHEELRLTNKVLIKKYGDDIPTWEQYENLLNQYISIWNNTKRAVLRNGLGEMMSPLEAFSQNTNLKRMTETEAIRIFRDPYPSLATVDRGEISVNGIYYSHPMFMALNGKKVKYYYNETAIHQLTVASEHGEIFSESAKMVLPGLQVGDDMSALVDTRHREKIGKAAYLAITSSGSESTYQMHKSLEMSASDMLESQSRRQEQIKDSKIKLIENNTRNKKYNIPDVNTDIEISDEEFEALLAERKRSEQEEREEQIRQDKILEDLYNQSIADHQEDDEIDQDQVNEALRKLGIQ